MGILWAVPVESIVVQPKYSNVQQQHVTLAYGVDRADYENIIGLPAEITLIAEAWNDEVQAIRCVLPTWLPCQNKNPHLAISWVDESAPVKANLMLDGEHEEIEMQSIAHCIIEFYEWQEPTVKTWKDRPLQQCLHVWKTGDRAGRRCQEMTRRMPPYCTKHRPRRG